MFKLLWAWATVSFSTHPECLKAPFTSIWSFETFTSSEFSQLMLQQLRQVYTKSCNYKTANNLDYVQTSRCVHIHYVQTRHCVHIHYVQTRHCVHIVYVQTSTFKILFPFFWRLIRHSLKLIREVQTKLLNPSEKLSFPEKVFCGHVY